MKSSRAVSHSSSAELPATKWRVFCAIAIPEEVKRSLHEFTRQLQSRFPQAEASWNTEAKPHLTLKFLGHIPRERVTDLSAAAAQTAQSSAPFSITIGGTGRFPTHGPARVLWIGIDDSSGDLQQLYQRLEEECLHRGFEREDRSFNPHLTLARLRNPQRTKELARAHTELRFPPVETLVQDLSVYRSELGREGSKYSIISTHQLMAK
jgi:RNA 2',3'-cyclic 3'-phosphodiesterase